MSTPPPERESVDLTYSPEFPLPRPVISGPDPFIYSSSLSPEEPPRKLRITSSPSPRITTTSDATAHTTPGTIRHGQTAIDIESSSPIVDDSTYLEGTAEETLASTSRAVPIPIPERSPSKPKEAPLSSYTCPVCYCAPKDATLTPCGHIMCGSCLFGSVRAARTRALDSGRQQEADKAYCPVCRAVLAGWDGRGGGVIGLEIKVKIG